ncbi:MAG: ABC transporter ATP-binding protein/permease [Defluviitaleaceae bacterium]|nr:ABC transporter ATP-binding protein/permease [Defluviitaleaceae bacterium]
MLSDAIKKALIPVYKLRYIVLMISIINIFIGLVSPFLMSRLINDLTYNEGRNALFIIGSIIAAYIIYFFLDWAEVYQWKKMENLGAGIVRGYLFSNVLHKSYRFFKDNSIGDINNKIINDSALYAKNEISSIPTVLLNLGHIVIICIILFTINFYMAIATVLFSFIFFFVNMYINKELRKSTKLEREAFSKLTNVANETLMGINTIQLYSVEHFFDKRFEKNVEEYEEKLIKNQFFAGLLKSSTYTLIGVMTIVAILVGLFFANLGHVSIGGIVAYYLFLPRLSEPIKNLADYNIAIQTAKAVEDRLEKLLVTEKREDDDLEKISNIDEIKFRDLSLTYPESEGNVLNNINATFKKGDSVAIIGRSGAGKTSLLRLLKKQLEPTSGEILINGKNKTQINRQSYIDRVAVLSQQVFIFDSTLQENISFGKNFPEKRVRDAAKISCIDHFSMDENSFGLSGGERQRIGLARALACDFDVLILDEPTSELDSKTEDQIIENLKMLQEEKQFIMIVVTHSDNVLNKLCNKKLEL